MAITNRQVKFKLVQCTGAKLTATTTLTDGYVYFCTDTKQIYADLTVGGTLQRFLIANNYTYTLLAATSTTLGGVKIGSNISNSSGTISLSKDNVTGALGYTPLSAQNTATLASSGGSVTLTDGSSTSTVKLVGGTYTTVAAGSNSNEIKISSTLAPSTTIPKDAGTAATGSETNYARGDHVHPLQKTIEGNAGSASKVQITDTANASSTAYDLLMDAASNGSTQSALKKSSTDDVRVTLTNGTASAEGVSRLSLGNTVKTGTANNSSGELYLYNASGVAGILKPNTNSSAITATMPNASGTLALTSQAISSLSVSGTTITYKTASGTSGTITTKDTTYSVASSSANGLMSSTDKAKLDGIAEGANNYTLPIASTELGGVMTTSTVTSTSGYTPTPIINGVPYYKTYTSLKNPYSLTLTTTNTAGTATTTTYDGSAAKSLTISPANIGAAAASHTHSAEDLTSGTLDMARIADLSIATAKLANLSVTDGKLAANSVLTAKIKDANVTADKLASNSVTTIKIVDKNVTTEKIADKAVTEGKLADGAVTNAKLATGIDASKLTGTVPSDCLPGSYDEVQEYTSKDSFPTTGVAATIYVDTTTNLVYRWTGSAYIEISSSLALGETSSTAYRGDYGKAAYEHGVTNKGKAFSSGLYKITTNSEGHVTAATAVAKSDITALGIPASDTNTTYSAGTGLSLSSTTFNHSNSITAGTVAGTATSTLAYSGSFKIPSITYDAQGHITSTTTTTITLPAEKHNVAKLYAGASKTAANATTTNGNTYITVADGTNTSIKLTGSDLTTVTSDASGNVTVKSSLPTTLTLTSFSKSLTITESWLDTGISGSNLETGTYAVRVENVLSGSTTEAWSGVMSWYKGTCSGATAEEIVLHNAGAADSENDIYLRTLRVASGSMKLQIAGNYAASAAVTIKFSFRRLI
jgi:hypothetical protein